MSHEFQTFAQSLLASSAHATLAPGHLAVVMARAGVGKTACLVQWALDALLGGQRVFHVSLSGDLDRVQAWYDTLLEDRMLAVGRPRTDAHIPELVGRRIIHTTVAAHCDAAKLDHTLAMYREHTSFSPDLIILDELDWSGSQVKTAAALGALKSLAARHGAVLWMSAQTHRDDGPPPAGELPAACQPYVELIDLAIDLHSREDHVQMRLVKDRQGVLENPLAVQLQSDTMRLRPAAGETSHVSFPAGVCTLLSGGAAGTEEVFGACAERWGVREINFSFEGRPVKRERGVVLLTDAQLAQGNVSDRYLQEHMHRQYRSTPLFRKVLQSIWHEVNTARQVFVVGVILEDDTVKGGTGWAAELAKHLHKPLYVYDQERRGWFIWRDGAWVAEEKPTIRSRRFAGTGSRDLSDHGRDAIVALFERSFGPAAR